MCCPVCECFAGAGGHGGLGGGRATGEQRGARAELLGQEACASGTEGLGGPGEMFGAAWQVGIGRESAEPRLPQEH